MRDVNLDDPLPVRNLADNAATYFQRSLPWTESGVKCNLQLRAAARDTNPAAESKEIAL